MVYKREADPAPQVTPVVSHKENRNNNRYYLQVNS